ncbi:hypothetical protein V1503_24920 [Bacillus sp. SCS-151]
MIFTKDSGLVKVWVSLIMSGIYSQDQVPSLSNLKEAVTEVLNKTA